MTTMPLTESAFWKQEKEARDLRKAKAAALYTIAERYAKLGAKCTRPEPVIGPAHVVRVIQRVSPTGWALLELAVAIMGDTLDDNPDLP